MTILNTLKNSLVALTASLALSSAALAADAPASNFVAVVDTQVIMEKSTAITKIREQLDKKAEEFKKDSSNKEAYFKKKYDELESQKNVLAKDVYEKKNNDLNKEFGEAQKKVQENRGSLDKAYMEAMQQFEKALTDIVKDEATKIGSKIVLPKMQALYSDNSLDITNNVLDAVNKKIPSVSVKF